MIMEKKIIFFNKKYVRFDLKKKINTTNDIFFLFFLSLQPLISAKGQTTGQTNMSYSTMRACAEAGLTAANALFVVTYLLLVWNLMARSNEVALVVFEHLHWKNDCLEVDTFITKMDQRAQKKSQKHVYANPLNPMLCPILSLGLYLLDHPTPSEHNAAHFLFPPAKKKINKKQPTMSSTFLSALRILVGVAALMLNVTLEIAKLGAHSLRKGGVTYATGGSTMAPSIIAILLRAGWSVKGVEGRYFKFENAMDQFLGRVICGHNLNSETFAILPPFFICSNDTEHEVVNGGEIFSYFFINF